MSIDIRGRKKQLRVRNYGKYFLWLVVTSLAVILDLLVLRIWHRYRQLLASHKAAGMNPDRRTVLGEAMWILWGGFRNKFRTDRVFNSSEASVDKSDNPLRRWLREHLLRWPLINLALALLGMYAGQYLMIHMPKSRGWGMAVLLGGLLLAFFRQKMATPGTFHWNDAAQIGLGILICLPLALDVENWMAAAAAWDLIWLWVGAILLVATPALKLSTRPIIPGWPQVGALQKWEWGVLGGLVAGAFLLRVIAVGDIPRPIDPDEASLGLFLMDVAEGRYRHPFGTGWATHPALQYFFMAPLTGIITRPTVWMRMPSVILGSLAVGAFYLASRAGWGRRVGIIAGTLLMCSDVSIHFSRLGVNNISDSLFAAWTIGALWFAASTGQPWAYIGAGLGLGLGQYYYFGNRALPFVVLGTVLVWAVRNRQAVRLAWTRVGYIFLVASVVAGPLIGLMIRDPYTLDRIPRVATFFTKKFVEQADKTGETVADLRWQQVRDSLLVFTVVPDRGTFYNPGRAMLPSILAPLFFVGVLVLFLGWKKPASLGTLVWMGVFLTLGSALINTAATFQRLLGLYPAVILVTALGLETSAEVITRQIPAKKLTANWIMAVVTLMAALGSLYFYFLVFNTQIVWKVSDQEAAAVMAREYEEFNGEGTFVLNTQLGVGEDGTVYLPMMKIVAGTGIVGSLSLIDLDTDERPIRIYFFYDKFEELSDVRNQFPGGDIRGYRRPADGEIILIRYTIP